MLFSIRDARGGNVIATDGAIGELEDFYFDDSTWALRYAVVNTGTWLGRRVLLGTPGLDHVELGVRQILTNLSRDQIRNSPGAYSKKPVARREELELYGHYGWAPYWGWSTTTGSISAGIPQEVAGFAAPKGDSLSSEQTRQMLDSAAAEETDPHLRSAREVIGFYLKARDGHFGHVEDFIADDRGWTVQHAIVDTVNWFPGRKVVLPVRRIEHISWNDSTVWVSLSREQVRRCPDYDSGNLAETSERALSHWQ